MTLSYTQKTIGRMAAGLGLLQATTWLSMALACIIVYNRHPLNLEDELEDVDSDMVLWKLELYMQYLYNDPDYSYPDLIVIPSTFTVFMWLYLVLNTLLFLVSALQILPIYGQPQKLESVLKAWSIITGAIALVDFVLVVLLGADFHKCNIDPIVSQQTDCVSSIIPMLVIAAKGFVLWIVNIIFAYVIYTGSAAIFWWFLGTISPKSTHLSRNDTYHILENNVKTSTQTTRKREQGCI